MPDRFAAVPYGAALTAILWRTLARLAAPAALLAAVVLVTPLAAQEGEEADALAQYLWTARPVIVFADRADDPRLLRQLREIESARASLEERDVVVIVDTEPGPSRFDTTPLRMRFRPHDFNVLLIDKDGEVKLRRPSPIAGSQLVRMIDRLPLRQQEIGRR